MSEMPERMMDGELAKLKLLVFMHFWSRRERFFSGENTHASSLHAPRIFIYLPNVM